MRGLQGLKIIMRVLPELIRVCEVVEYGVEAESEEHDVHLINSENEMEAEFASVRGVGNDGVRAIASVGSDGF